MNTDHMTDTWIDSGQYCAQDVVNLRDCITSLQSRLEAAEGENGRLRNALRALEGSVKNADHLYLQWEGLRNDNADLRSRAQQAEEMAGRAVEEKLGLVVDCERLATDLEQALRQWKMYAEEREDEDLDKESHTEALSYRAAVKTAKDWRDKAFAITHPKLASTSPPSDRTDKERLDWLEKQNIFAANKGAITSLWEFGTVQHDNWPDPCVQAQPSLRCAIDDAMSASLPVAENEGRAGA